MKKPAKPRHKKYAPKPVSRHGGLIAIAMAHARGQEASPLRHDQLSDLGLAYWLSLDNLRAGDANEECWSCVTCALNIGMVLSERGIGPEHEETFVRALDGAFRAKIRSARAGSFRLDGQALTDIEAAFHIHDQQMAVATRAEVGAAMAAVRHRIDAGNVYQAAA